jgi:chromosome condensin MukBEF ATPase and DNA-binding subunit MukB
MAIDLLKLEKRFIDLLENTTQEEFEQWLLSKTKKPMAQQTAVEWLVEQLPEHLKLSKDGFDMLQQAKEMEREQIVKAHDDGDFWRGENYYTQTYTTRLQNETN